MPFEGLGGERTNSYPSLTSAAWSGLAPPSLLESHANRLTIVPVLPHAATSAFSKALMDHDPERLKALTATCR